MFAWAPIPPRFASLGSVEFSKLLLARAKVAVAPGLGFGEHGEGYVRIALVENTHRLRQAVRNIRAFLQAGSTRPIRARSDDERGWSVARPGLLTAPSSLACTPLAHQVRARFRRGRRPGHGRRRRAEAAARQRRHRGRARRPADRGHRGVGARPHARTAACRCRACAGTRTRWRSPPIPAVDVVVELIGGSDGPARALVEAAIAAGKPVVTANKAMLAVHGAALAAAAEERGVPLAFEAAVAGGIPVIKALREGLAGNRILRIAGILNGTCNYILTQMRERGREFAEVLADAQKLGYAEADPSFDIDGIDAAHKLAILAALAFGRPVAFDAVHVEGIRRISALDIAFASELGYRIKLLGIARQTDGGIEARVHPCMVPQSAPIARVDGVFNAVVAEGDFVGRVMLEGRGAGAGPTASAVVADLIDIARNRAHSGLGRGVGRRCPTRRRCR